MTSIFTANIGSYPRNGDEKDHQRHRRGVMNFQNREISAHAFRDVEQSVIQEVLAEQINSGLDEVTDGQISWNDPISHFGQKISGVKITGLRRFFDANFYYRVPVITGKPKKRDPFVMNEFIFSKQNSTKTVRAILTGPLTLAHHVESELKSFQKVESRIRLFTEMLEDEIKRLEAAGCTSIQIDEPSILKFPSEMKWLTQALSKLSARKKSAKLTLAVYFGAIAPLYPALLNLPIDGLQMDFTYDGKKLWDTILASKPKIILGLGLLNARQTKIESIDSILDVVRKWTQTNQPASCFITPSAGLEYLPRSEAQNKLRLLAKIRSEGILAHV